MSTNLIAIGTERVIIENTLDHNRGALAAVRHLSGVDAHGRLVAVIQCADRWPARSAVEAHGEQSVTDTKALGHRDENVHGLARQTDGA